MTRIAEKKLIAYKGWMVRKLSARNPSTVQYRPSDRTPTPTPLTAKRLTAAEMTARRQKGLCYNCDDNWSPEHRCKAKFQGILMEETEEESKCVANECEIMNECEPLEDHGKFPIDLDSPNISYHALRGHFVASTLRLKGNITGKMVTILVDSGSTHNFIQTKVARQWRLPIEPTNNLQVTIGDWSELLCEGKSCQVPLKLGEVVFRLDLFILPIHEADVVLGAQWLAELGTVTFNYQLLWMKFQHQGREIVLKGIQNMGQLALIRLGQLQKGAISDSHAQYFQLEFHEAGAAAKDSKVSTQDQGAKELQQLLDEFAQVFALPHGLPPKCKVDH